MKDLFHPDNSKEFEFYAKGDCLNSCGFKGGFVHNYLIDEIRKGNLLRVFNHKRKNDTLSFTCLTPEGINFNYFGAYLGDVFNALDDLPADNSLVECSLYREDLLVKAPENVSSSFFKDLEETLYHKGEGIVYDDSTSRFLSDKIKKNKEAKKRLRNKLF